MAKHKGNVDSFLNKILEFSNEEIELCLSKLNEKEIDAFTKITICTTVENVQLNFDMVKIWILFANKHLEQDKRKSTLHGCFLLGGTMNLFINNLKKVYMSNPLYKFKSVYKIDWAL